MLWQQPPPWSRVPSRGEAAQDLGGSTLKASHISGENPSRQKGGVLPFPRPAATTSCVLARRPAVLQSQQIPCQSDLCAVKRPTAACTGQQQACTAPSLPGRGVQGVCRSYFCLQTTPHCHGPAVGTAAGGQLGAGTAKIHPSAHEVHFYQWGEEGGKMTPLCGISPVYGERS